jgi:hypothetical protein
MCKEHHLKNQSITFSNLLDMVMSDLEILDGISSIKNAPSDFPSICNFANIKYDSTIVIKIAIT